MMDQEPTAATEAQSREQWNQARRRAFYQRLSRTLGLSKQPADLLAFDEVQAKLRLNQSAYRGLQQVPLDQIVGSVGRYHDFTRTFLPLVESDAFRWQRVASLQAEAGLPPIELYKVGEVYFVKDGNHRVSVARQFGMNTIEAYVWEYESKVGGFKADAKPDDLITRAEHRAFLDDSRLDVLRPDQNIVLTAPGMYPELTLQLALYRENLKRIDGEDHTYEDVVTAWYDMVYTLAVDTIRESGVLESFPGRTQADLYVWVSRHRQELSERYGERISIRDAVEQIVRERQKPGPVERIVQTAARSVAGLVQSITSSDHQAPEPLPPIPDETEPLGRLIVALENLEPQMTYRGERGDDWRTWRNALRDKVKELLVLELSPSEDIAAEVLETVLVSGVERVKIRLRAYDGLWLPAYLMRPAEVAGPLPGLLVYPGQGTIRQTAGLENSPLHANALALAQAGYVTLSVEERGLGELGQVADDTLDSVARLAGRSWLGMTIEDGLRALDYLQSRPDVRPDHLGATGLGVGAGLALYTAALDERVRAVVVENFTTGGMDPILIDGYAPDIVPGLLRYAELCDIARLIVPRPALYAYPKKRATTRLARQWFDRMRPLYEIFSCPDRTRFLEHEDADTYSCCGAAEWFDRWLVEEEDTSVLLWAPRE